MDIVHYKVTSYYTAGTLVSEDGGFLHCETRVYNDGEMAAKYHRERLDDPLCYNSQMISGYGERP